VAVGNGIERSGKERNPLHGGGLARAEINRKLAAPRCIQAAPKLSLARALPKPIPARILPGRSLALPPGPKKGRRLLPKSLDYHFRSIRYCNRPKCDDHHGRFRRSTA
jgi:hypothetical protein